MLLNDATVPAPEYLRQSKTGPMGDIGRLYPPHTRVYHRTGNETLCTLSYGVTQRGARKILYEMGVRELGKGYDFALSEYCGGQVKSEAGVERKGNENGGGNGYSNENGDENMDENENRYELG